MFDTILIPRFFGDMFAIFFRKVKSFSINYNTLGVTFLSWTKTLCSISLRAGMKLEVKYYSIK